MNNKNEAVIAVNEKLRKKVLGQVYKLLTFIEDAARDGMAVHRVEGELWRQRLDLGLSLLLGYFRLHGNGDQGERVELPDHTQVKRLEQPRQRIYRSVFGACAYEEVVYGTREGQAILWTPLSERLQLPASNFSYLLQDWDQGLEVEQPYNQVSKTIGRILGFDQSVNSLERHAGQAAEAIDAFWAQQPPPPLAEAGSVVVCSADGKGVPMRLSAQTDAQANAEGEDTGQAEGTGTKKMALLGAVYTVSAFVRTPEEVLEALFRDPNKDDKSPPKHPKPIAKFVRACLERDEDGTTMPQTEEIFSWMASQVQQRNPTGERPVAVLIDGQDALWKAAWRFIPDTDSTEVTEILDLLHATSSVWEAARLLYPNDRGAAERFAKRHIKQLLEGHVGALLRALRRRIRTHELRGKRLRDMERICTYFANNGHRMAYDQYLAQGFPIATGVIEGACRCVVKDRMERSGMRWCLAGAQVMLGLRSIHLSDLWDPFMEFRIERECRRLYPHRAANEDHYSLPMAA